MDSGQIGTWAVQDGLGIVLVRSFFRLAIRDHFFEPLGCLLESFWGVFVLVFGHVGAFFGPSWSRNRLRTDLSSKK